MTEKLGQIQEPLQPVPLEPILSSSEATIRLNELAAQLMPQHAEDVQRRALRVIPIVRDRIKASDVSRRELELCRFRLDELKASVVKDLKGKPLAWLRQKWFTWKLGSLLTGVEQSKTKLVQAAMDAFKRASTPEARLNACELFDKETVNSTDSDGNTPLSIAIQKEDVSSVQRLVALGARDVEKPLLQLLKIVSSPEDVLRVCELFDASTVNVKDTDGNTPLHVAAQKMSPAAIQLLIRKGADQSAINEEGETPLQMLLKTDITVVADFRSPEILSPVIKPVFVTYDDEKCSARMKSADSEDRLLAANEVFEALGTGEYPLISPNTLMQAVEIAPENLPKLQKTKRFNTDELLSMLMDSKDQAIRLEASKVVLGRIRDNTSPGVLPSTAEKATRCVYALIPNEAESLLTEVRAALKEGSTRFDLSELLGAIAKPR